MKEQLLAWINEVFNLLPKNNYFINSVYKINWLTTEYIDSTHLTQKYQREVYKETVELIKKHSLKQIMDVGCGHGYKLNEFIRPLTSTIVGVDLPSAIAYCQSHYDYGRWIADDIENPTLKLDHAVDLIICADVIEHLRNPDALFAYFQRFSDKNTWIILSTPEREKVRGAGHLGPPPNKAHVREWNEKEFRTYVESKGLHIFDYKLVDDVEGSFEDMPLRKFGKTCQLVVGKFT